MKRITLTGIFLLAGFTVLNLSAQTSIPSQKCYILDRGSYELSSLYNKIDSVWKTSEGHRPPLIGISSQFEGETKIGIGRSYIEAVRDAGGIPVVLPITDDANVILQYVNRIDGLLLAGGEDIHPFFYHADPNPRLGKVCIERDYAELSLIHLAIRKGLPILGICRGMQLTNVALGGTLEQDIPSAGYSVQHLQEMDKSVPVHEISIEPDSHLSEIVGTNNMKVNSFHHQCVKELAPGLKITAYSNDRVPEAFEGFPAYNIIGVQFHPEGLYTHDEAAMKLFRNLIKRSEEYQGRKE